MADDKGEEELLAQEPPADDACTEQGNKYYCIPCDFRLSRDMFSSIRLSRIIIEGLSCSDIFSPTFVECCNTATFFNIMQEKDQCIVYLRFKYSEEANAKKEYIQLAFPNCTVLAGDSIKNARIIQLAELQAKHNHFLEVCTDYSHKSNSKKDEGNNKDEGKKKIHYGVLLNNIPNDMTETHLATIFPDAHTCWIARHTTSGPLSLTYSYAFAAYDSDEKAEEVLQAFNNHVISLGDDELLCVNFGSVRTGVVNPAIYTEAPENLNLSDACRRILVHHVDALLGALQQLASQSEISRRQRKNVIQRKKDISRMIYYTVCLLNDDKQRRLNVGDSVPETEEEIAILTEASTRPSLILGKDVYEGYLTKKTPPPPNPYKREICDVPSLLSPAIKRSCDIGFNRGVILGGVRGGVTRARGQRGWQQRGGRGQRGRGQSNQYGYGYYGEEYPSDTLNVIKQGLSEMSQRLQEVTMNQDSNYQGYYYGYQ